MIAGKLLGKFMFVCYRYDNTFSDLTEHMLNEDLIQITHSSYEHQLRSGCLCTWENPNKILVSFSKLFYVLPNI